MCVLITHLMGNHISCLYIEPTSLIHSCIHLKDRIHTNQSQTKTEFKLRTLLLWAYTSNHCATVPLCFPQLNPWQLKCVWLFQSIFPLQDLVPPSDEVAESSQLDTPPLTLLPFFRNMPVRCQVNGGQSTSWATAALWLQLGSRSMEEASLLKWTYSKLRSWSQSHLTCCYYIYYNPFPPIDPLRTGPLRYTQPPSSQLTFPRKACVTLPVLHNTWCQLSEVPRDRREGSGIISNAVKTVQVISGDTVEDLRGEKLTEPPPPELETFQQLT